MGYTSDSLVAVYPFTRQVDGEEVIIGHTETDTFLVLPFDAVEILDYLALGKTIGETQLIYQQKYGELPDIEDLLHILENKGFVKVLLQSEANYNVLTSTLKSSVQHTAKVHYHFQNFPQSLAQKLFSRPVLIGCYILFALAFLAVFSDPTLIPSWEAYYFPNNTTLMIVALVVLDCVTLFLHEMAHLVAARALGVSCRIGISNRMWMLVAETDMTGIWNVNRKQRYLPFLAGPLLDLVSAAILILIFFAENHKWITMSLVVYQLSRALLLNYLLGLLWQCYFFVRTDFYYVIANFFHCKNLMKDTEVFVRNQISRLTRRVHRVDQSHIPAKEMLIIRSYAVLWLVGRTIAIASLIFITLPLIWHYCIKLFTVLSAGFFTNPYAFVDALLLISLACIPQLIGFTLWIRSFSKKNR
ncbi:MAG: site-2 protease family protein [Nostoc sp. TH1S01]|nr:site-2 protease family protein [Nostoc sp. TH1S01]